MATDTQQYTLSLLADALHQRKPKPLGEIPWQDVQQELLLQGVTALVSNLVPELGLSPEQRGAYKRLAASMFQRFYRIIGSQTAVLSLLNDADIPAVILKGTSAAIYYASPDCRTMGDIDILVHPQDFLRAYTLLCSKGYRSEESPEQHRRHITFTDEQGIEIELHDRFSTSQSPEIDRFLDDRLFQAIDRRQTAVVCGNAFPMLPEIENGLVLLAHINHHLHGGLGLRQIMDWQCFVERHPDEQFWREAFLPLAEQIGLERLAAVVTAMCRKWLGLSLPCHWDSPLENDPLCDELMDYIFARGNFGQKDKVNTSAVSVVRLFRNPFHGLASAQRSGVRTWKALRRHPWLRPFAWLYQLLRWMRHGHAKQVGLSYLCDARKQEKQESDLLQRLGVTRL